MVNFKKVIYNIAVTFHRFIKSTDLLQFLKQNVSMLIIKTSSVKIVN